MTEHQPRLLARIDDEIQTEYGKFALQIEQPNPEARLAFELEDLGTHIVGVSPGGVVFASAAIDHYPSVRIDVWTAEPAAEPADQNWEIIEDALLPLEHRTQLRLRSQFGDRTPVLIELYLTHHLRVHVRGRAEAVTRGEAEFFHGVEQWLVQIWPAESGTH